MTDNAVYDLSVTDALLTTTRAVRKRLDFDKPVPKEVIMECLDISQQAPTGGNRQGWSWLVVTEQAKKDALADMFRRMAGPYLAAANEQNEAAGSAQDSRVFSSAEFLAERIQDVPVMVIPCINVAGMPKDAPPVAWASVMGSIFPAVWNFQLALRSRGLGSTLTTFHLRYADEAAELLGIPDDYMQAALLPVAYTVGTEFKAAKRPPIDSIVHWENW